MKQLVHLGFLGLNGATVATGAAGAPNSYGTLAVNGNSCANGLPGTTGVTDSAGAPESQGANGLSLELLQSQDPLKLIVFLGLREEGEYPRKVRQNIV